MKKILNIIVSLIGGVMWRLGGADGFSKGFRRYGVSGIIGILATLKTKKAWLGILTMGLAFGAFSLGYGESSSIAQFVYKLGIYEDPLLDITIRAIVGLAYGLSFLPTIIASKNYKNLLTIPLVVILVPSIRLLGNTVGAVIEEFLIGTAVVGSYCLIRTEATGFAGFLELGKFLLKLLAKK